MLAGISAVVAYIITEKLAGEIAATKALVVGSGWALLGTLSVLCAWRFSFQRALLYQLYDGFLIFFGANSMLLAVAMPLFFAFEPTSAVAAALAGYSIAILIYQVLCANRHFAERWAQNQEHALTKALNRQLKQLNTDVFINSLNLEAVLALPGKLSRFGVLILGLMLISMVVGLNLRKLFPQFSAFAYGIPALTFLSVTTQIVLFRVLIAYKLIGIEREIGAVLAPTDRTPTCRKKNRNRQRR